jgi:hypothetical protein
MIRPQPRAGAATGVEDAGEHGRHERGERDVALLQRARGALGVERLEHDRARRGRRARQDHQPADVRERHRAQPALAGVAAEHGALRRGCGRRRCRRSARRREGRGVVPEVWTISAISSSRGSPTIEGRAAVLGERGVDEELGAAQQVLALALAEPRVDRHGGRAEQEAGVEGDHEGAAGGQRDRNAVAGRGAAA